MSKEERNGTEGKESLDIERNGFNACKGMRGNFNLLLMLLLPASSALSTSSFTALARSVTACPATIRLTDSASMGRISVADINDDMMILMLPVYRIGGSNSIKDDKVNEKCRFIPLPPSRATNVWRARKRVITKAKSKARTRGRWNNPKSEVLVRRINNLAACRYKYTLRIEC
jgi:hypothetical protein